MGRGPNSTWLSPEARFVRLEPPLRQRSRRSMAFGSAGILLALSRTATQQLSPLCRGKRALEDSVPIGHRVVQEEARGAGRNHHAQRRQPSRPGIPTLFAEQRRAAAETRRVGGY